MNNPLGTPSVLQAAFLTGFILLKIRILAGLSVSSFWSAPLYLVTVSVAVVVWLRLPLTPWMVRV
jgi:hypothetical protein